ncbi:MAG: type VI secretion system tip protein VgrG [Gammaproteobacteria bacterium]|nr:type VI secretion system tip protein VgrG [Gammaproteobacteria bacterium]MBU1443697.1 type VI secretion system tip protein VgrG [Gammaproteobacteria bacterium]MBU2288002.1 type VI secretion system tip protein VgrG [Gammaproteobacteria bacterium]MBU2410050.1 type VI secretion system tip protein VgrG [Gammaproteobacteria bacterium]
MTDTQFIIQSDSPVNDDLLFWSVVGQESLSRPAIYELTVLSKNEKIDAKDILGRAFDVVIEFLDADGGKHERHCQGHAVRFMRKGGMGRFFEYRFTLRSWFWLLTKRINSRILQDKPLVDVFDAVVEDSPVKRFKKTQTDNVIGTHEARRYCVQHQESDYQFLSRLMEDEGVYYWFDTHDAPGTMHLSDASDVAHDKLPAGATLEYAPAGASEARYNEIFRWTDSRRLDTGKFASRDSDFKSIRKKLSADKGDPDVHELADLEAFEFPGGYMKSADTEDVAKIRMDELAARRRMNWALTRWPDVAAGMGFSFKGHPMGESDGDYLIASCLFVATHPGYESMADHEGGVERQGEALRELLQDDPLNADWIEAVTEIVRSTPELDRPQRGSSVFLLTVIPAATHYRPPRLTPRVTMPGPQSAIVVGPSGQEIHADDFGRVKVHFHWDRYDESNEKSTCWVRVSQPWAGKGWGGYFIPRIGQEVIVDFLNGDPDRPIIVGRVYNDDQPIPFESHTQSGFRTRSTPNGGNANFNELRFDDKKGSEQVFLHAEKNQDIEVESDETHWVGHDRKKTIDHDETSHIKNNRTETVDVDEKIDIGANRTETVGANEDITIGANRTETVGASESVTIGANRELTVGANETVTVGASRSETIAASTTQTIGASATQTIGASYTQTVGGPISITSGGPMTFMAAGGFTVIAPGGTKIIDFQLGQIGGQNQIGYGFQFNFSGINLEANVVKGETTLTTNAAIGIKTEVVGVETLGATAVQKAAALEALSNATGIEMDALKIFL